MIQKYLDSILKTAKAGDATEQSYYPDLKKLLEDYVHNKGFDPAITVQAKRQIAGIPDFTIRKEKELVGYVEAKDPKYDNLGNLPTRDTEQLKRYIDKLPNVILTNYFDFWLYREGKLVKKATIGFPEIILQLKTKSPVQNEKDLLELLGMFLSYYITETKTPKNLARELAHRAHLLTQTIVEEIQNNKETEIDRIYNAFKEFLIADLSPDSFADIYAQTLTYGLFTARLHYMGSDFDRKKAGDYIPKSIKILKDTFNLISGDAIPESLESYIDDIATILAHADMVGIKQELKKGAGDADPLIHFYETFLAEYDPAKRKSLGVYYTPLPIASFIVRSVNALLKSKLQIKDGLINNAVTLLDPASGTMTFLAQAINESIKEQRKYSDNTSSLYSHFVSNFYAFEYQMGAYVIGHLRMALLFEELGMPLTEKYPLYLTNSLDFSVIHQSGFPFVADLAKEAEDALKIKQKDILIILGNPPYTSEKKEKGQLPEWIKEKLQDYAKGLDVENEKKKGVLQDDYIRFLRFSHWKIAQRKQGIVAFITNNSYLDGIIHRSMRKQLLDTFDEIYILNLHGNSRINEKNPAGGNDENVFDIQQGVAIAFFVKTGTKKGAAAVYYQDLFGKREDKYNTLNNATLESSNFKQITPSANEYFFVPKDYSLKEKWDSWLGLDEIFTNNANGIETGKDELTIYENKQELIRFLQVLVSTETDDNLRLLYHIKDGANWKLGEIRQHLKEEGIKEDKIKIILYRPFDYRWTYFDSVFLARSRKPLMNSLCKSNNLALIAMREYTYSTPYSHALLSDKIVDRRVFISNRGAGYVFPLFVSRSNNEQSGLFHDINEMAANFSEKFLQYLKKNMQKFSEASQPEDIFYYIYGILYANPYREKYLDFLKSGFPRIPFVNNAELFFKVSELGKRLAMLHLSKSDELDKPYARLVGDGDNRVTKREFAGDKLWINEKQYFTPVTNEIFNYYIGGYQIADKYLKDRQKRENATLTKEEVVTYCRMLLAIFHTIEIQKEIDRLYLEIASLCSQ